MNISIPKFIFTYIFVLVVLGAIIFCFEINKPNKNKQQREPTPATLTLPENNK